MSWDPLLFLKQTNISSPKVVTKSVTGLYYSWNCSNLFWSDLVQTTSLKFCKIKRSNMSCWEAHVGFFRLFMKGIFGPYVLWHFDKKLLFLVVTLISTRDYTVKDEFNCLVMKTLKSNLSYSAAAIKVHYRVITVRSIVVRSQAWSRAVFQHWAKNGF